MKTLAQLAVMLSCLGGSLAAQPVPLYEHFGTDVYRLDQPAFYPNPPTIDATTFINYGEFYITNVVDLTHAAFLSLGLPYEPNNVLNFTNYGKLWGLFGFRFDHATETGRSSAASFLNDNSGYITGVGLIKDDIKAVSTPFITVTSLPSRVNAYVNVWATNVVNSGVLETDNSGLIEVKGRNVDLSYGGIRVKPIEELYQSIFNDTGIICFFGGTTLRGAGLYIPDEGITDLYWGQNPPPDSIYRSSFIYGSLGAGPVAITPPHTITLPANPYLTINRYQFFIQNPQSYVYTNALTPTNVIVQAVFVSNADPNILSDVRFGPSTIVTNPYTAPVIEFSSQQEDIVTGNTTTNHLYFMDQLVAELGTGLLTNVVSSPSLFFPTAMPTNYAVSRTPPCEFYLGRPPNAVATPDLLWTPDYVTDLMTNYCSAYAFNATNVSLTFPTGESYSNSVGRIDIVADQLNMTHARIRGEGFVSIQSSNFLGSADASVDVDNVGYNLGSDTGTLLLQNVANTSIRRFCGNVYSWSGVWTNYLNQVVTNLVDDGSGNLTNVVSTNVVETGFYVWIVDNQMQTQFPVKIQELITHSTNLTVADSINLYRVLTVDAERLTVTGGMTLNDPLHSWTATNFPNLKYLTNDGTIDVNSAGYFGSDRPAPYLGMVNRGLIQGSSVIIRANAFENTGQIVSRREVLDPISGNVNVTGGPITVQTVSGKIDGGQFTALQDIRFGAGDLKFRNHTAQVGGALYLTATNALTDNGPDAGNLWQVSNGFNLLNHPPTGDLLGTKIVSVAGKPFNSIRHTWAGQDRGASAVGYTNNAAVGYLVLDSPPDGRFTFSGTGTSNALYADYLELRGAALTNLAQTVSFGRNFVLYFGAANVPVEDLDGLFPDAQQPAGRLRWVRDYAGPRSGMDVALADGRTIRVNRALRFSKTIDSDGDGVVNFYDYYPFDGAIWNGVSVAGVGASREVTLSWIGAPLMVYQIESATNLSAPNWMPVMTYTNLALVNGTLTVTDRSASAGEPQRYYRIRYNP